MKVLFVTPAFYPAAYWGGPIHSTYGLCNALAGTSGIELKVLTTDTAGPALNQRVERTAFPVHMPAGYEVYYCRRILGKSFSLEMFRHLYALLRWADVVHLTAVYSSPTILTLLLCRLLKRPVVWSPRGGLQRWSGSSRQIAKHLWERLCDSLLVPGRAVLHVTSEMERLESGQRIQNAECICIPNGVDVPTLPSARVWQPEGRLRILYMGRLDVKKGIENLLAALARLADRTVELTICGQGDIRYEAQLRQRVVEHGLGQQVRFGGLVTGDQKSRAFFEADLCVVPSFTENFAMVVAEALVHGVPVIASTGTPWSALGPRGCGLWVANDPATLKAAILQMRQQDLREMGEKARVWMDREFAWARVAQEMGGIYRRLQQAAA